MSKHLNYLLVILLFSILGMKALFFPGLFTAHDIWHQIVRLYYYFQAVNDGALPPYWIGQLAKGFGYPLFFFSYHLPWIIGVSLMKIGMDISTTIKTLFFLSFLTSGISMYFFVSNLLKNKLSALLSALLYLWLPYHFLIIFVGGSMGIAFVFTFLPILFLGIHKVKEKEKFGIPIFAVGFAGIILSHIMHLVFLSPVILIFLCWELLSTSQKINFFKNISVGIILGILLSAFYLLPAIYYNQFTRAHLETGFSSLFERNFINFTQLIYSKWGYSPIINNAKNGENSFQLGIAQWIGTLALIIFFATKQLSKTYKTLSMSLLGAFIISTFLMLDYSKPIWTYLTKFATVDFPYRLLLPSTFVASVCAGIVLAALKKLQRLFFIFLIIVAVYTNRNHINVNQYTNFPISTYLDLETEITTNTFNEYLPIQANAKLLGKPWNEVRGENSSASNLKRTTNTLSFDLDVAKAETVSIGQFYFPGQTVYLDKKISQITADKEGRISLEVSKGTHTVLVKYQETLLIKISKLLTIIGILGISLATLLKKKLAFN